MANQYDKIKKERINERMMKNKISMQWHKWIAFGVLRTNIDLSQAGSTCMEDIVSNGAIVAVGSATKARHGLYVQIMGSMDRMVNVTKI
jgi:hypothetical protein